MSELFNSIAKFYKGNRLPAASFVDLALLAGKLSHGLAAGSSIEMIAFDGAIKKTKTIAQISRTDTAECLKQLAALIADRLDLMSQEERDRLDRATRMLNGINSL